MASPAVLAQPRPTCGRCRRPISVCYCVALPRIETATRVVILQHPRERDMPIGTARMASLCLPQAELHVGIRWGDSAALARVLGDPARPPVLLYPGPGARDILRDPPRGPVTLVVVDGTWSQAKTVVRDNPVLQALPRYAFATPEPSQYRIRREPRAEYVSTIEAVMHVLGALEGEPARFRSLLDPLRAMVDAQLACQARSPRRRERHPRPPRPPRPRVPDAVAGRFDDLVCVVGEANAWPYRAGVTDHNRSSGWNGPPASLVGGNPVGVTDHDRSSGWNGPPAFLGGGNPVETTAPPEELVHWVAHRVATGETFTQIAAPEQPLSPSTTFHIELAEDELRRAAPRAELFARFARFCRPTDILCAWGHHSHDLAIGSGGTLPQGRLDLRAEARRLANRKLGSLEAYASALAPAAPPLAPGRAGKRLAMLVEIVRAWHALASAP